MLKRVFKSNRVCLVFFLISGWLRSAAVFLLLVGFQKLVCYIDDISSSSTYTISLKWIEMWWHIAWGVCTHWSVRGTAEELIGYTEEHMGWDGGLDLMLNSEWVTPYLPCFCYLFILWKIKSNNAHLKKKSAKDKSKGGQANRSSRLDCTLKEIDTLISFPCLW